MARTSTSWKAGQSGNPAGRPKGSRNKLGEQFLAQVLADFEQHGGEVIERVRRENPETYLRVVASLLPRQTEAEIRGDQSITVKVLRFSQPDDDELLALQAPATSYLASQ